ncbi:MULTISPECIES: DNA ligase [Cohnella]|uniref:ATP-dependent DNA ligase n=1 Tax=Cohnella TaxID=329857 RepID=UPI0009B9C6FF|nr:MULTISPECIES: DNA ligase [Cohnella]MBN2984159.1 DNA ligase [Cohnella algarum]
MIQFSSFEPMSPILTGRVPEGSEWGHQLKWDGYRLIASVRSGQVKLYSKHMAQITDVYAEVAEALAGLNVSCVLDGEAVVMDPRTGKPSFQLMQQRAGKMANRKDRSGKLPVQYIVFDLLELDGEDWRSRPFAERNEKLARLAERWPPPLFTTELFADGKKLWAWVEANEWEGVVSKRLASPYRIGKKHNDWLKTKTEIRFEAEIVGITRKEGRISSLVMCREGRYVGRVSSGLDGRNKEWLAGLAPAEGNVPPPIPLPKDLRKIDIVWLREPFKTEVTGREWTDEGMLRHPKIRLPRG